MFIISEKKVGRILKNDSNLVIQANEIKVTMWFFLDEDTFIPGARSNLEYRECFPEMFSDFLLFLDDQNHWRKLNSKLPTLKYVSNKCVGWNKQAAYNCPVFMWLIFNQEGWAFLFKT